MEDTMKLIKEPYLQMPEKDSITIMWETSDGASSEVSYWETERVHWGLNGKFKTIGDPIIVSIEDSYKYIHSVKINDLKPATTYHYRVSSINKNNDTVSSGINPFKTAVPKDIPFSFVVTSETAGGGDMINNMMFEQISKYRPDFLIFAGDMTADGLLRWHWDQTLFIPAKEMLKSTPFYMCLGNHENNSEWFYKFTAFPEPKNYYSFDYGNTHFTCLDSTSFVKYDLDGNYYYANKDELKPGSAQFDFLVEDLKSADSTWKIVYFHYPPYVSGDFQVEQMRALSPVLEKYGVDIVFNSHTLVYERSHPIKANKVDLDNGIIYIVNGGASVMPEWFNNKRAWHTAQALAIPNFIQVIIADSSLELHAISHEGQHFDTIRLDKNLNH